MIVFYISSAQFCAWSLIKAIIDGLVFSPEPGEQPEAEQ
jgi:hypothetical protein